MQYVPDAVLAVLGASHTVTVRARLYLAGVTVAGTDLNPPMVITDGSVTVDRTAEHSRSISLTIVDTDGSWVPRDDQERLDPAFTPLVEVWRGVQWAVGSWEWSLGTFVLDTCTVEEQGLGAVVITASGQIISALVASNRFTAPYAISSTSLYSDVIKDIITDRLSPWGIDPVFAFETSTVLCPDMALEDDERDNPWIACQHLALADGKELLCVPPNVFVLRTVPDVKTSPAVLTLDASDGSLLLDTGNTRTITAKEAYNGVIVNGSAPWLISPVQGIAWDTNPDSNTYYLGPFGQRAKTISDAMVATDAQAQAAAEKQLPNYLGALEEGTLNIIPCCALDAGDVLSVDDVALGMTDRVMLERFSISLNIQAPMPLTIKRTRRL